MTESDEPLIGLRTPSQLADVQAEPLPQSVGQRLQRARLDAGLTLEALSTRLKISVPRLQAIENDQFEQGPNLHISRAMVASIARFLGLSVHDLLAQLPQPVIRGPAPQVQASVGGFGEASRLTIRGGGGAPIAPVWWVAAALLLLAGLVYFYPKLTHTAQQGANQTVQESVAPAPVISSAVQEAVVSTTEPTSLPASGVAAVASAPSVSDRPASTPKVDPVLVFKARGSTWIEVTDAKGVALLRRTLGAAEVAQVVGELPLSVVIGRADHTEVVVRGAAFPLETHTQDNVARFKVP